MATVRQLLTHQLWIIGEDAAGNQFGTQLQLARVLDDLYTSGADDADEATLGPVYAGGSVTTSILGATPRRTSSCASTTLGPMAPWCSAPIGT